MLSKHSRGSERVLGGRHSLHGGVALLQSDAIHAAARVCATAGDLSPSGVAASTVPRRVAPSTVPLSRRRAEAAPSHIRSGAGPCYISMAMQGRDCCPPVPAQGETSPPVALLLQVGQPPQLRAVLVAAVPDVGDPAVDQVLRLGGHLDGGLDGAAAVVAAHDHVAHLEMGKGRGFGGRGRGWGGRGGLLRSGLQGDGLQPRRYW